MNKTAIKNFAIWARNKHIADISYKAGLLGITENGIKSPLPQSTQTVHFFDIGTKEPSSITGTEIQQRKKLVEEIERKAKQSDYASAFTNVIEEVAYTWFNRLIAIRFMEVNDYLPTRIRVLSSESKGKAEPDLVTHALEASFDYSAYEKDRIIQLKHENKLDELFRMLFIKQCNSLNSNLPELFERTSDYTELLLNVSFTDKEGVVYHLVHDIAEDDFNVTKEGQVEIIGWLYQYYNTEPKDETFALLKKNVKITKERIPAATQLFTPDWIVRYMVENSLGRLWLEGHPDDEMKSKWVYFLDEAEQEPDVIQQLHRIREEYEIIKPEEIKVIDPAMGSGHILVYAFDILLQIYESCGYNQRDAAKKIVEHNLFGLDIDQRAYQLAYFAIMMKARQYNRKILNGDTICNIFVIRESNDINNDQLKYFGDGLSKIEKNTALNQLQELLKTFHDATEYGSILDVENYNWDLLRNFVSHVNTDAQLSLDTIGTEHTKHKLQYLVEIGSLISSKYDVVITNPPYMGLSGGNQKLNDFVKKNYPISKSDLFSVFIEKSNLLTKDNRFFAMITQHSWMFLSSFEKLRFKILESDTINMIHLGARAFEEIGGEVVQTTSWIQRKSNIKGYRAVFSRLVDFNSQKSKEDSFINRDNLYIATKEYFSKIPGSPIAYWVSERIFSIFEESDSLEKYAQPRQGMATCNNEKYLRLWFEPNIRKIGFDYQNKEDAIASRKKWFPYHKGGGFRKWYGNLFYVVDWENDGEEIKALVIKKYPYLKGNYEFVLKTNNPYFKEGITWSDVSTGDFACRYSPTGFMYDVKGTSMFPSSDILNYTMGLLNSNLIARCLNILNPTMSYQVGNIKSLPMKIDKVYKNSIDLLVDEAVDLSKSDWDSVETSWDFKKHPLLKGSKLSSNFAEWNKECETKFHRLKAIEEELNSIFLSIYGLTTEFIPKVDEKDITIRKSELSKEIKALISYSVGCMFGRYSLDQAGIAYAGGEWDPQKYHSFIPDKDNILPITDEEYFEDDINGLFIKFLRKALGNETLEENLDYIANALGNKGKNSREIIRNYFTQDFYKDHCTTYSVTGAGKRPIYWLFDSGKQNGFKALIYMHRYDENTIGNLRIDYLHRMQRIYENEIARMQDTIDNSKDARELATATKRKEKLIKQLQETKEYDEKIAHLALARTSIDLDDGVKVNYEKVQTDRDGKKLDVLAKI